MRLSVPLALILLSLPLAADFWGNSDRYKEDFSYDFKLAPGGRLEIESFNGSVEVIGWDNDTVQVRGNKHASRQEVLKALAIDAKGSPTEVRLRAISPSPNCNCGVTFTVKVPRKTKLDNVTTSNASLRIENIEGRAHARTSNGGIRLYDLNGDWKRPLPTAASMRKKSLGRRPCERRMAESGATTSTAAWRPRRPIPLLT